MTPTPASNPQGANRYGVDVDYFRRELAKLAESLPTRPPAELSRYFQVLANIAADIHNGKAPPSMQVSAPGNPGQLAQAPTGERAKFVSVMEDISGDFANFINGGKFGDPMERIGDLIQAHTQIVDELRSWAKAQPIEKLEQLAQAPLWMYAFRHDSDPWQVYFGTYADMAGMYNQAWTRWTQIVLAPVFRGPDGIAGNGGDEATSQAPGEAAEAEAYLRDALSGKGFHPDPDILRDSLKMVIAQPPPESNRGGDAESNYVADHESEPKQFKFANGRRVWITSEGYLNTDFGPMAPGSTDGGKA